MRKNSAPLFQATYRVLVLKNRDASQPHERVASVSIDHNLAGRGRDIREALEDLKGTIWESLKDEWENLLPAQPPDPEPEYLRAFQDPLVAEIDGDQVLQRLSLVLKVLSVRASVGPKNGRRARKPARVEPRMVYEAASVAAV